MIFACVSMIARAVGQKMATKDSIFKDIIDQMLGVGLRYANMLLFDNKIEQENFQFSLCKNLFASLFCSQPCFGI